MSWIIALFVVYWQFIVAYIVGGAFYSVLKWIIELYRLRRAVLADPKRDRTYIAAERFGSLSYPPKASQNKSTLFWWAVFWPINLVWTLVADVAREAWGWLYRKFGAIYDRIAKAILPE